MTVRQPKIIVFAGSLRAGSYNKALARHAARVAEEAGAEVRLLDLTEYDIPLYNADIYNAEAANPYTLVDTGGVCPPYSPPMPAGLLRLREHFRWADGWIVVTPEYNGTFPAVLHNLFEWLTRLAPGERIMELFTFKAVTVLSAAFHGNGKAALEHIKSVLTNLGVLIVPNLVGEAVVYISDENFGPDGALVSPRAQRMAKVTIGRLVDTIVRLKRLDAE